MKIIKKVYNILAINPGSTSTKVALFENGTETHAQSFNHGADQLKKYSSVSAQADFRASLVDQFLTSYCDSPLDGIAARGGLLKPIPSGVYRINDTMLDDLKSGRYGEHASNLGAIIASNLENRYHCPSYICDPVVVDEMDPVARISGLPEIERKSIFHALNHKSAAREIAGRIGKEYTECNFIVAHMGGGISVGAHCKGRVIDVNNGLGGEGPFSPERSGGLPSLQLAEYVYKHVERFADIKKRLIGQGGMIAYCGTNDLQVLCGRIELGDKQDKLIFDAMVHQISKEIAQHGASLKGVVDAIILTGGMANNSTLTDEISERVSFLAPVYIVPGERELSALAENILAVLMKKRQVLEY